LSEDMSEHSIVHQLTNEQIESVATMTISGLHSYEIVSTLRQSDTSVLATRTTVTSRIKGSHAILKAYLQTFTGNLHCVYTAISLARKYQEWSKFQQLAAQDILKSIIDEPSIALQDPSIVHTKNRFSGAPNNQKVNSTKRDPSGFKLVNPKARHCAIC
ncbi:9706_t:CDS:2, partial [Gigaspora margarita]